jgi:hypothetical protein
MANGWQTDGTAMAEVEEEKELTTKKKTSSSSRRQSPPRPDVEELCQRLLDRVTANGATRARITEKWRTDARLLLDRDDRTLDQSLRLIDWATDHDFWASVVLSMPKFREKYDQLLMQARREHQQRQTSAQPRPYRSTTDDNIRQFLAGTGTDGPPMATVFELPRGSL